jgi:TetR/AcrR family transcriptional repressor of nem operon
MARPVAYDTDKVIELAVQQFWEDGFGDCDVETLTQRISLNRHSLYKAFGGKSGLFLDALAFYVDRIGAPYIAILESGSCLDDIVAFFDIISGGSNHSSPVKISGYGRRGCLITNTVAELGRSDPAVSAIIDRYYERFANAFIALIARGQACGSIRADIDPEVTGHWLLLTSQGMSLSARNGSTAPDMGALLRATLAARSDRSRPGFAASEFIL